jgi:N-acetylneuraminic acid mutarotase
LRTILAWRPGAAARVAGTLPKPLRYAAVAAVGGRLIIAGGTSGEAASRDVYSFDPADGSLAKLGLLAHPLTHAAAAEVGGTVLLVGGREASPTSQTRRILAIGADGKIRTVGLLPRASSDLAAVALGRRAIVAGGRDGEGHVQDTILTVTPS